MESAQKQMLLSQYNETHTTVVNLSLYLISLKSHGKNSKFLNTKKKEKIKHLDSNHKVQNASEIKVYTNKSIKKFYLISLKSH